MILYYQCVWISGIKCFNEPNPDTDEISGNTLSKDKNAIDAIKDQITNDEKQNTIHEHNVIIKNDLHMKLTLEREKEDYKYKYTKLDPNGKQLSEENGIIKFDSLEGNLKKKIWIDESNTLLGFVQSTLSNYNPKEKSLKNIIELKEGMTEISYDGNKLTVVSGKTKKSFTMIQDSANKLLEALMAGKTPKVESENKGDVESQKNENPSKDAK